MKSKECLVFLVLSVCLLILSVPLVIKNSKYSKKMEVEVTDTLIKEEYYKGGLREFTYLYFNIEKDGVDCTDFVRVIGDKRDTTTVTVYMDEDRNVTAIKDNSPLILAVFSVVGILVAIGFEIDYRRS